MNATNGPAEFIGHLPYPTTSLNPTISLNHLNHEEIKFLLNTEVLKHYQILPFLSNLLNTSYHIAQSPIQFKIEGLKNLLFSLARAGVEEIELVGNGLWTFFNQNNSHSNLLKSIYASSGISLNFINPDYFVSPEEKTQSFEIRVYLPTFQNFLSWEEKFLGEYLPNQVNKNGSTYFLVRKLKENGQFIQTQNLVIDLLDDSKKTSISIVLIHSSGSFILPHAGFRLSLMPFINSSSNLPLELTVTKPFLFQRVKLEPDCKTSYFWRQLEALISQSQLLQNLKEIETWINDEEKFLTVLSATYQQYLTKLSKPITSTNLFALINMAHEQPFFLKTFVVFLLKELRELPEVARPLIFDLWISHLSENTQDLTSEDHELFALGSHFFVFESQTNFFSKVEKLALKKIPLQYLIIYANIIFKYKDKLSLEALVSLITTLLSNQKAPPQSNQETKTLTSHLQKLIDLLEQQKAILLLSDIILLALSLSCFSPENTKFELMINALCVSLPTAKGALLWFSAQSRGFFWTKKQSLRAKETFFNLTLKICNTQFLGVPFLKDGWFEIVFKLEWSKPEWSKLEPLAHLYLQSSSQTVQENFFTHSHHKLSASKELNLRLHAFSSASQYQKVDILKGALPLAKEKKECEMIYNLYYPFVKELIAQNDFQEAFLLLIASKQSNIFTRRKEEKRSIILSLLSCSNQLRILSSTPHRSVSPSNLPEIDRSEKHVNTAISSLNIPIESLGLFIEFIGENSNVVLSSEEINQVITTAPLICHLSLNSSSTFFTETLIRHQEPFFKQLQESNQPQSLLYFYHYLTRIVKIEYSKLYVEGHLPFWCVKSILNHSPVHLTSFHMTEMILNFLITHHLLDESHESHELATIYNKIFIRYLYKEDIFRAEQWCRKQLERIDAPINKSKKELEIVLTLISKLLEIADNPSAKEKKPLEKAASLLRHLNSTSIVHSQKYQEICKILASKLLQSHLFITWGALIKTNVELFLPEISEIHSIIEEFYKDWKCQPIRPHLTFTMLLWELLILFRYPDISAWEQVLTELKSNSQMMELACEYIPFLISVENLPNKFEIPLLNCLSLLIPHLRQAHLSKILEFITHPNLLQAWVTPDFLFKLLTKVMQMDFQDRSIDEAHSFYETFLKLKEKIKHSHIVFENEDIANQHLVNIDLPFLYFCCNTNYIEAIHSAAIQVRSFLTLHLPFKLELLIPVINKISLFLSVFLDPKNKLNHPSLEDLIAEFIEVISLAYKRKLLGFNSLNCAAYLLKLKRPKAIEKTVAHFYEFLSFSKNPSKSLLHDYSKQLPFMMTQILEENPVHCIRSLLCLLSLPIVDKIYASTSVSPPLRLHRENAFNILSESSLIASNETSNAETTERETTERETTERETTERERIEREKIERERIDIIFELLAFERYLEGIQSTENLQEQHVRYFLDRSILLRAFDAILFEEKFLLITDLLIRKLSVHHSKIKTDHITDIADCMLQFLFRLVEKYEIYQPAIYKQIYKALTDLRKNPKIVTKILLNYVQKFAFYPNFSSHSPMKEVLAEHFKNLNHLVSLPAFKQDDLLNLVNHSKCMSTIDIEQRKVSLLEYIDFLEKGQGLEFYLLLTYRFFEHLTGFLDTQDSDIPDIAWEFLERIFKKGRTLCHLPSQTNIFVSFLIREFFFKQENGLLSHLLKKNRPKTIQKCTHFLQQLPYAYSADIELTKSIPGTYKCYLQHFQLILDLAKSQFFNESIESLISLLHPLLPFLKFTDLTTQIEQGELGSSLEIAILLLTRKIYPAAREVTIIFLESLFNGFATIPYSIEKLKEIVVVCDAILHKQDLHGNEEPLIYNRLQNLVNVMKNKVENAASSSTI